MRLNESNLEALEGKGISVPRYDRKGLRRKIAHLGPGHFHRAHFLTYLDRLIRQGDTDWGVFELEIVPSNGALGEKLKGQDCLYSLLSLSPDGSEKLRVNGPIMGYTSDPEEVLEALSSPETELITLTITEKGYAYDGDGNLDFDDPGIAHDLVSDGLPVTACGFLSAAFARRFETKAAVTVMSCDNIPENGDKLKAEVLAFCERKYPGITAWVEESVAFPCTMVDRITPGTTDADIKKLSERYGLEDDAPVHSEEFLQWVIEDRFSTPVPDFSKAGALVVPDVKPYELMKIRLLNGSHSALSYPAYMMGITRVDEAAADPLIKTFIRDRYMEEITLTLPPVPGMDLDAYKDELIERFSNPYIADTVLRLASDGSKKIANAILRPLEEGLGKGLPNSSLVAALSLWEFFYLFRDEEGKPMPLDDPAASELLAAASSPRDFLRIAGLRTPDEGLFKLVEGNLSFLEKNGVKEFLRRV